MSKTNFMPTQGPPAWTQPFLEQLREVPSVTAAAAAAGITTSNAYHYRKAHPEYAEEWDKAKQVGLKKLLTVAFKRAEETSDKLMVFLLKAYMKDRFQESLKVDATLREGDLSDDELLERVAEITARDGTDK
jgi:hypothetical protein